MKLFYTKLKNPAVAARIKLVCSLMVVLLLALGIWLLLAPKAVAQPYFTNSGTIYGAQVYNQSYPTPLNPAVTLANQYAAGTLAGSIAAGLIPAAGTYTNSFGTNIFTSPPFPLATASITNTAVAFTSVTVSNFVVTALNTNCVVYWEVIGH